MENVNGLASYKNGEFIKEIIEDFENVGYEVDYNVLDSADFGVPQHRKRIFFIGNRLNLPNNFPQPTHFKKRGKKKRFVSVWQAIGDLPRIRAGKGAETMEYNKPIVHEYQDWARKGSSNVFNHVSRAHKKRDTNTFKSMNSTFRFIKFFFNWVNFTFLSIQGIYKKKKIVKS